MTTEQTLTSSPALLPHPFPERFQTGDSREVQLFHFVRKKAKTKDKCNPFQTDCRLTLPVVSKKHFREAIRQFLFVRILGQNREKQAKKTTERAKTGKNTAVFHRIGLLYSKQKNIFGVLILQLLQMVVSSSSRRENTNFPQSKWIFPEGNSF